MLLSNDEGLSSPEQSFSTNSEVLVTDGGGVQHDAARDAARDGDIDQNKADRGQIDAGNDQTDAAAAEHIQDGQEDINSRNEEKTVNNAVSTDQLAQENQKTITGGSGGNDGEKILPTILFDDRSLRMVAEDTLQAIQKGNSPPQLFQSNHELVRIQQNPDGVQLEALTVDTFRHHLDGFATFKKKRYRKDGPISTPCPPPMDFVRDIMAMPSWEEDVFPTIERISQSPFFTKDGTMVMEPGYNAFAKIWYAPDSSLDIPAIPFNPSEDDVEGAKNLLLKKYFGDFPLVDAAGKANTLAYMLTAFVREMISSPVPMGILEAPSPGTGKSLLVKCINLVTLGKLPAMTPQPENEAEWRKTITAHLVKLPQVLIFDNLSRVLNSASLAEMLTSNFWSDRVLGSSRTVNVPIRCITLATANNLQIGGEDLPRRIVWIRLDAKMERPDERKSEEFKIPKILEWGLENRGKLIHAALVLVQAWIASGKPMGEEVMGSYESWAQTLGGILKVAGVDGFLTNAAAKRMAVDDDSMEWKAFCEKWFEMFQGAIVGTKDLFKLAQDNEMLTWIMEADSEAGQRRKFGRALTKKVDCCYSGYQIIEAERDSRSRTRQYKLQPPGENTVSAEEVIRILDLEIEPSSLSGGQLLSLESSQCYDKMSIINEFLDYTNCLENFFGQINTNIEADENILRGGYIYQELVRIENNTRITGLNAQLHILSHQHPILNAAWSDQLPEYEMAREDKKIFQMIVESVVKMHNYDVYIWKKMTVAGRDPESCPVYGEILKLATWADNIDNHLHKYRMRYEEGYLDDCLDS